MMEYEVFKKVVIARLREFLPEELADCRLEVTQMLKVNRTLDCINLFPLGVSARVSPNLYINDLYEAFQKSQDLNLILKAAGSAIGQVFQQIPEEGAEPDFAGSKDRIVINLINTEENRQLLAALPHREFMDLSVIYRFVMGKDDHGLSTVRLDNRILEELAMTEDEVFRLALANTRRMFPMVEEFQEQTKVLGDGLFRFLTNAVHLQGAACLLFEEELYQVAQGMRGSFYVIPSSVHEIIAVSAELCDPQYMKTTLCFANRQDIVGADKLSDHIYFYDKKKRALTVAC